MELRGDEAQELRAEQLLVGTYRHTRVAGKGLAHLFGMAACEEKAVKALAAQHTAQGLLLFGVGGLTGPDEIYVGDHVGMMFVCGGGL